MKNINQIISMLTLLTSNIFTFSKSYRLIFKVRMFVLLIVFSSYNLGVYGQCNGGSAFGSATAPTSGSINVSTCNYFGEYNTINAVVSGNMYTSTINVAGGCITVHTGSSSGPVVASGTTPLNWTATSSGTYYILYSSSCAGCGTDNSCHTTTLAFVGSSGTCIDGIQNQGETGIDCGGPCVACPNCYNGIMDGNETGIDCGPSCPLPCHCSDGVLSGNETAVDCGGSCGPCPVPCNVDLTYAIAPVVGGCCTYVLNMFDSFGDGWNSASIRVTIDGVVQGPFTIASGSSATQNISVCNGNSIDIDYTASGSFPSEVSFNFVNSSGTILYTSPQGPPVTNNIYLGTAVCSTPGVLDCNGGQIALTAVGLGTYSLPMNNNFNGGGLGSGWVAGGGQAVGTLCGPNLDNTPYYWASTAGTGVPQLTTASLDVSCGGVISFDMDYATQGGSVPCEGPDEPDEGVTFQYSTNGGATWTIIQYWDPLGGYDAALTNWNTYSFPIPPGAVGPNTQFQWIQVNSSGSDYDNWGIDNVQISSFVDCSIPYWYDYSYLPPSNDNPNQTTNITGTTTYTVNYTNGVDACSTSLTVVVPPGTTANAGPDVTMCAGGPGVVIGANPVTPDNGATFSWSASAGSGTIDLVAPGITNGQVTVSPGVTTTYTLTVTFNGCTTTDQVTVTVTPGPVINPGTSQTVCLGTQVTLTATGATTFSWDNGVTQGTAFTPPLGTTTYTVSGTTSGCVGTATVNVIVNPIPVVSAPDATVCAGGTVTLTAVGGTTYSWAPGGQTTASITVTPLINTTYTVTGTTLGCSSSDDVLVTVSGSAVISAGLDLTTCVGTPITITATGGVTYVWSPATFISATTGASVTFTPGTTTTYTVNGTDAAGCTGTDEIIVTVNPLPTAIIAGTVSVCQGAAAQTITFTGAGATAPYTFTYTLNGGANQTITSVGNTATVSVPTGTAATFTYALVSVASTNTCSQAQAGTAIVTVNALPSPIIIGASTYCAGQFSTLSTSVPFTTYLWSSGVSTPTANVTTANNPISVTVTNAQGCSAISPTFTVSVSSFITYNSSVSICQGQSVLIHGVSQNTAATYSQTYVLGTGCDSISNVTLTVNPLPVIAVADQTVCAGTAVTLSGNGANTYTWTGGVSNGAPFTPAATTTYTVTGTNSTTGCTNTDDATITLNPLPTATISGTLSVCKNGLNPTITFTGASGTAPY
ncbi:MAG: hypothetical protein RI883_913, partial [Bacteroidota bacterium]